MFSLHPRLAADTLLLGDLPLCRVLLMNDRQYRWLILVPRRTHLREVHELTEADQQALIHESSWVSRRLAETLGATKMNVANIGNVVSQLHWHIIARFEDDPAWPSPVWGKHPATAYDEASLLTTLNLLRHALTDRGDGPVMTWAT